MSQAETHSIESPVSAVSIGSAEANIQAVLSPSPSPRARCRLCRLDGDPQLPAGCLISNMPDAKFVRLYTSVLLRLCNANGMKSFLPDKHDKVSIFYSTFRQPFSLESYVTRIVTFTNCSRSVFIIALVYLDRLKRIDHRLAISEMNVHRVLMTAVVLSCKFLEDELYHNSYFAKIGGIQSVAEFVSCGIGVFGELCHESTISCTNISFVFRAFPRAPFRIVSNASF
jgi:Cyclin